MAMFGDQCYTNIIIYVHQSTHLSSCITIYFLYCSIFILFFNLQVVSRNARIVPQGTNALSPLKQSLRYVQMARTQLDLKVFVHLVQQGKPVIFLVRFQRMFLRQIILNWTKSNNFQNLFPPYFFLLYFGLATYFFLFIVQCS